MIAVWAGGLLLLSLIVHLVLWRVRSPRHPLPTLLVIFLFFTPLAGAGAHVLLADAESWLGVWEWAMLALFYCPVSLAYVATFSAIEEDSPTLKIMLYASRAGSRGCSRDELRPVVGEDVILDSRMGALVTSGVVDRDERGYSLSPKGRLLARLFVWFYSILGIRGGG